MEAPKLVITCPQNHLPSIPHLLVASCRSLWYWNSKASQHVLNLIGLCEATQKSSQLAHCSLRLVSSQKLVWGLPGRLHTCSSLPSHMAHCAVSSLRWGSHTPVFSGWASQCVYGRSQMSPSDAFSEPPSQVTGSNCASGQGWTPVADRGGLLSHLCASYLSQKDIKHIKYNPCFRVAYCSFGGSVPWWRRFSLHAYRANGSSPILLGRRYRCIESQCWKDLKSH